MSSKLYTTKKTRLCAVLFKVARAPFYNTIWKHFFPQRNIESEIKFDSRNLYTTSMQCVRGKRKFIHTLVKHNNENTELRNVDIHFMGKSYARLRKLLKRAFKVAACLLVHTC
jgi:hypothetical protein